MSKIKENKKLKAGLGVVPDVGKKISELPAAASLAVDDLFILRSSASGSEKKITVPTLVKSLGNPAVSGFTATSVVANKIVLAAANGTPIDTYYDGMKVSFISPIDSTGVLTLQILGLGEINFVKLSDPTATTVIYANKYYEAIYNAGTNKFFHTNEIITVSAFVTNEYIVTATDILTNPDRTIFYLQSATGLPKEQAFGDYYNGMTATFTAKFDDDVRIRSRGTVFIKLDGLDVQLLRDQDDDPIQNDVFLDQTIIARYNGSDFIKNRFAVEADEGLPEPDVRPPLPVVVNPYDPSYPGNPRDPANTVNETSVDDTNTPIFDRILTVGTGGNFPTLNKAIAEICREFGTSGERRNAIKNIALVILNNYSASSGSDNYITGGDLRFITIFSQNNAVLTLSSAITGYVIASPIFNLKLRCTYNISYIYSAGSMISLSHPQQAASPIITFGKNTQLTCTGDVYVIGKGGSITAQYGMTVSCNSFFIYTNQNFEIYRNRFNINKLVITKTSSIPNAGVMILRNSDGVISNTSVFFTSKSDTQTYGAFNFASDCNIILINCTSTDRIGKMFGLLARDSNLLLNNCNFNAGGSGSGLGYDIQVVGSTPRNSITLDSLTAGYNAKYNQALVNPTSNGTIFLGN